jgi:hypothetical protein
MNFKILFPMCILLSIPIFAAEIVLKNGDAYIAEIISEDSNVVKLKWKTKIFEIPKSEIQNIDLKKTGEHISYHYETIQLKDGTKIKGVVVNQNAKEVILKTELGIISINRTKLENENQEVNSKFEITTPPEKKTNIGFHGIYSSFIESKDSRSHAGSGGFFLEPSFLHFNKIRFGLKSEYSETINSKFKFFTSILYFNYNYKQSNWLDFYFSLGLGGSIVNFKDSDKVITGSDPAVFLELGY